MSPNNAWPTANGQSRAHLTLWFMPIVMSKPDGTEYKLTKLTPQNSIHLIHVVPDFAPLFYSGDLSN